MIVWWIGAITLLKVIYNVGTFVWERWFRAPTSYKHREGEWAVVTGASDGIGKALALALATRGMNVVLMARTKSKLETVAEQVRAKGRSAEVVPFDFGTTEEKDYEPLRQIFEQKKVSVLVNNVGGSGGSYTEKIPERFIDSPIDRIMPCVNINIRPVVMMTHLALPGMVSRKSGSIINISSLAGVAGMPIMAPYGGAKAFVDRYVMAISPELAQHGILCESVVTGGVQTDLNPTPADGFSSVTPAAYAEWLLNTHGCEDVYAPVPGHAFLAYVIGNLPNRLRRTLLHKSGLMLKAEIDKKWQSGK